MAVSPSAHEPVRIAPMARRGATTNAFLGANDSNSHQYDRGSVYDDHGKTAAARGATAASAHDGDGATPRRLIARTHDETRDGSSGATAAADEACQSDRSGFGVGRSRDRRSATESMRGGVAGVEENGRAGGGQSMDALRADSVAAERNAVELVAVGYDEWKEACTAQGKM